MERRARALSIDLQAQFPEVENRTRPMNLASEFEKLTKLKDSGVISQEEYEQSKSRLLDACVQRIESLYEPKPAIETRVSEPSYQIPVNPRAVATSPDLALKNRPPDQSVERTEPPYVRASPANTRVIVRLVERKPPIRPRAAAPSQEQKPPVAARVVEPSPDQKPPAAARAAEPTPDQKPPAAPNVVEPSHDQQFLDRPIFTAYSNEQKSAAPAFLELLRLRKPPAGMPRGLPPVKVVSGVVQSVRLSLREDSDQYAAFVEIDGQQVEISASASVCVEAGDRVILSGYERDGRLLALAYHNESKGVSSNLDRVRRGYQIFLATGRASWFAGVAALVGTLILLIGHQPVRNFDSEFWRYVPYVLCGLGAAATSCLGLGLSVLGARAKEFYDALPWAGTMTHAH
jgi:putative oligomerization/nucleic acid binding protein